MQRWRTDKPSRSRGGVRTKHPHADRGRTELTHAIHNNTNVYNNLLQGCKTLSGMSHVLNPNYQEALCILARFMEHSSSSNPVPRPTKDILCSHSGACRAPHFRSDTQKQVFEHNHIVQAELVTYDPILRPALQVVREAVAHYKTFSEVVIEFSSRMKDVDGVTHDPKVYAQQHAVVTFSVGGIELEVTFETRAVFAAFLACKSMWKMCEEQPTFKTFEVGKRAATASKSVERDATERTWTAFSRSKLTPTQRNTSRFEQFRKKQTPKSKQALDDFFRDRMRDEELC